MDNLNETFINENSILESSIQLNCILEVFISDDSFLEEILA